MRQILLSSLLLVFFGIQGVGAQAIPENAHKTIFGGWGSWECDRGYEQVDNRCSMIDVPKNASIDKTGRDWRCNRGYREVEQRCVRIQVPENASLDITGKDWICNPGLKRVGDSCKLVNVPENASLNYLGDGWVCDEGYVKQENRCIPVGRTDEEIRELIISRSIALYSGSCPCPYSTDSAGRRCGGRSAYSRSGGHHPVCYRDNISDKAVSRFRRRY